MKNAFYKKCHFCLECAFKTIRQCVIDGSAQILLFRISDDESVDKGLMADLTVVQNGNLSIGLFDGQELKQLGEHCRHRSETLETVLRRDLHVVVTMKPETADRIRIKCFELFQNDRCVDIYEEWSNEVKFQTVQGMLARAESLKMNPEQVQQYAHSIVKLHTEIRFVETAENL